MKKTIQIVEDDISVKKLLEIAFKEYDFNYISTSTKSSAFSTFLSQSPDLLVVDLGLPDGDGKDLIKQIREIASTPIIVLTARYHEKEMIASLDAGADDYITKPFSVNELLARIRANLRRGSEQKNDFDEKYICNELELDISTRDVSLDGNKLKLTPIEYDLLKYFMLNPNKTLSHKTILEQVWGSGHQNEMQYLRTYVNTLRKRLKKIVLDLST